MMITAIVLAAGLVFGVHPVVIGVAAVAAVEPRLVVAVAAVWGIVAALRRRGHRVTADDEATFFRALSAELRSGSSLRSALSAAADRVPDIPLRGAARLAAAGLPMAEVADVIEREFPVNGVIAGAAFRLSDWSGARVAGAFDELADRATAAARLARERRAGTAQARLSAVIVGAAPLVFTALLLATGRGSGLVSHGRVGWIVLVVGIVLEVVGLGIVWVIVRRAER